MRSLEAILERLLARVDGAAVAALGGMDGLVVEQRPDARAVALDAGAAPDLAACVAELTNALAGARRAVGDALDGGAIEALGVRSERRVLVVRHVTPQHYLLLVAPPGSDEGVAEQALTEAVAQVRELMS